MRGVEFGMKIPVAMVDGYPFLEKLSWDGYNEAMDLKDYIENYHRRFGYYPESVHVDHIYCNREKKRYCKERLWLRDHKGRLLFIFPLPKRNKNGINRAC